MSSPRREEIHAIAEKKSSRKKTFTLSAEVLIFTLAANVPLKLKEISYIHSEAYAAGELKHGPLALIEQGTPVIALATDKKYYDKLAGNIREVRARGAYVVLVCRSDFENAEEYADAVLCCPTVQKRFPYFPPWYFRSCWLTKRRFLLGRDVDRPRNLAKIRDG